MYWVWKKLLILQAPQKMLSLWRSGLRIIHQGFAPGKDEIEIARRIVHAYHEAQEKGLGVVALESKMIDPPVVNRAHKTLKLAKDMELIYEV